MGIKYIDGRLDYRVRFGKLFISWIPLPRGIPESGTHVTDNLTCIRQWWAWHDQLSEGSLRGNGVRDNGSKNDGYEMSTNCHCVTHEP